MTTAVIGALRVNLGLDSAQFQRGLSDSQRALAAMGRQFAAVAGVAAAFGAAVSAAAMRGARAIDDICRAGCAASMATLGEFDLRAY